MGGAAIRGGDDKERVLLGEIRLNLFNLVK